MFGSKRWLHLSEQGNVILYVSTCSNPLCTPFLFCSKHLLTVGTDGFYLNPSPGEAPCWLLTAPNTKWPARSQAYARLPGSAGHTLAHQQRLDCRTFVQVCRPTPSQTSMPRTGSR